MTNIFEVIGRHVADEGREATDFVLEELRVPDKWADLFRPLVEQEVLNRARAHTRRLEHLVFTGSSPYDDEPDTHTGRDGVGPVDSVNDRIALLREAVFIASEGRYIQWGLLTVDQHLERADRQRRLADTITVSAERHEASAALIEKSRVVCLNDIADFELALLAA